MGFGDLQPDGSIDDKANSNNGDMIKVLATMVQVLGDFVSKFKELPPAYPFTHTLLPPGENPFPEKLKKAQEMLSKTKFLDSK